MHNLSYQQIIVIGVACLFGIPICVGLVIGHFMGFWSGLATFALVIFIIALVAQRWWQKQNKGKDNKGGNQDNEAM